MSFKPLLPQMDSRKLALLCRALAENRKAEDVVILDVRELSSVTDYFVLASGTSEPHLRAIVDEITEKLQEEHGLRARAVERFRPPGSCWIISMSLCTSCARTSAHGMTWKPSGETRRACG